MEIESRLAKQKSVLETLETLRRRKQLQKEYGYGIWVTVDVL